MEDSGRFAGMGDSRKVRDMDDSRSGSEVQKRIVRFARVDRINPR